jgi:hypothetical protein
MYEAHVEEATLDRFEQQETHGLASVMGERQ